MMRIEHEEKENDRSAYKKSSEIIRNDHIKIIKKCLIDVEQTRVRPVGFPDGGIQRKTGLIQ